MMFLHKNRKWLSLLFLGLSSAIFVPLFLTANDAGLRIFSAVLWVACSILGVAHFTKGPAGSIPVLVILLMITFSMIWSVFIPQLLPLPSFMDSKFFGRMFTVLITVFITVIPLPRYAKEWVDGHSAPPKSDKKLPETPAAADEISQPHEQKDAAVPVTYEQVMAHKKLILRAHKPYAFENLIPRQLKWRLIVSGGLSALGFLALAVVSDMEDSAPTIWTSPLFWTVAISLFSILWALVLFIYGFLRSLLVPGLFITGGMVYLFYAYLIQIRESSPFTFTIILLLLAGTVSYTIFLLIRYFRRHSGSFFAHYEKNNALCGIDLSLHDMLPIADYTRLYAVSLSQRPESDVRSRLRQAVATDRLNKQLNRFCRQKRMIYAGFYYGRSAGKMEFFIYGSEKKDCRRQLQALLHNAGAQSVDLQVSDEADWNTYRYELYPDENTLFRIINIQVYERLEERHFDFSQPLPLTYVLRFGEKEDALTCLPAAETVGYEEAVYQDSEQEDPALQSAHMNEHFVVLRLTSLMGLERLHLNSQKAIELAAQFHGQLLNWHVEPQQK